MTVYNINNQGQAVRDAATEEGNNPTRESFDERVKTVEDRLQALRDSLKTVAHPPPAMRPAPQAPSSFRRMQNAGDSVKEIVTMPNAPANVNDRPSIALPPFKWSVSKIGAVASASWLATATYFISSTTGFSGLVHMPLHQLGSVLAGLAAPPALLWMVLAHIQRNDDFRAYLQPIVDQLKMLTYPAKDSEARVRALTDSLKAQAEELTAAAEKVESTIGRARASLRAETATMQKVMNNTGARLETTSTLLVERTSQMAKLSELLDGRIANVEQGALNGSFTLEKIVDAMIARAAEATIRFEQQVSGSVSSLHTANGRMIQVADELGARMHAFESGAANAANIFGDVSARFAGHEVSLGDAAQKIDAHMQKLDKQFSAQFADMTQLMERFSGMGGEIGGSVRDFRESAESVVIQAMAQIRNLSENFTTCAYEVQSTLDRSAGQALTQIQGFDQQFEGRLVALKERLAEAASTTPDMIKEIMNEVTRQLLNIEMRFAQTGQATRQQIAAIEDQLGQSLQSLDRIANSMGDQAANTVRQAVGTLAGQLHGLRDGFAESAQTAQKDLKDFHGELAGTIEGLSVVARQATDRTVERIIQLNASVAQRIMDMRDASEIAAEQNQNFAAEMVNHIGLARGLHDQLSYHADKIGTNTERMAGDLIEATAAARVQSEIISQTLGRDTAQLREELNGAMSQLENMLGDLSREGADLYTAGASNVQHLREITQDMRAERAVLEHATKTLDQAQGSLETQLGGFGQAIQSLKTELGDVISSSTERLDQFKDVGETAKAAAITLTQSVQAGVSQLDESAARLVNDAQNLQTGLRQQSQEMAITAGQVAQQSDEALSNYRQFTQTLSTDHQQLIQQLDQSMQMLKTEGSEISLLTDRSAKDIIWLSDLLDGAGNKINQTSEKAAVALRKSAELAGEQTTALQSQAISGTAALQHVARVAAQETQALMERNTAATQIYHAATEHLREMGMEVSALAFRTHDELGELARSLQNAYQAMASGNTQNVDQLVQLQQQAQHIHQDITARAQSTQQQLQAVEQQMQNTGVDMGLITDQAIQKVHSIKQQLSQTSQEVLATATETTAQIAHATQQLIDQAQTVAKQGTQISQTMQAAAALQQQHLDSVSSHSQQARSAVMAEVDQLRQLAQQLAQTAQSTVGEFNQQQVKLGQAQQQMVHGTQQNLQAMTQAGQAAQQQWQGLHQQQQQAAGQLQQNNAQLTVQVDSIKSAVAAAQTVLMQAGQSLAQQADQTLKTMNTANQRGQGLVEMLGRQLGEMQTITQEAVSQTEKLQNHEFRSRREVFLNNAKQVIEGLHSLSIDLTKALDPIGTNQDWQAIAKGDLSTFTKRLVGIKDEIPAQKIREKYWQNADFRGAVMRYLRQFEELIGQAIQLDTADLLASTLMTSDIGKLYSFLATAMDHQQLPQQKAVA